MSQEKSYWTTVLKRIIYLVLSIIAIICVLKLAVFYMPFLIAFLIAVMIEPLIKWLMKSLKISRKFSSIIIFIVVFGGLVGLLVWGIITIISESSNLLSGFNEYYEKAYMQIQSIIGNFNFEKLKISDQILNIIENAAFSMLEEISQYLQNFLSNLLRVFTSIPTIAIYFVVSILSLYFICTDKIYMLDEVEHHLPEKWVKKLSSHVRAITKTLGGYLKAQATLIFISFSISLVGLYIFQFAGLNVAYPLLIALGIGFVDALPILGSGTAMVPWAIISALNGDIKLAISIVVLWIIMSITKQIVEPKIVSGNIGIHPIFTIIAMYTRF